ncbi:MAG: hypothetical protein ABR583_14395 [Gaiellaceae bacterium]
MSGWYVEIVDGEPERVFVRACSGAGCATSGRPDVECCNPLSGRTAFIAPDPAPPCPVFGEPIG